MLVSLNVHHVFVPRRLSSRQGWSARRNDVGPCLRYDERGILTRRTTAELPLIQLCWWSNGSGFFDWSKWAAVGPRDAAHQVLLRMSAVGGWKCKVNWVFQVPMVCDSVNSHWNEIVVVLLEYLYGCHKTKHEHPPPHPNPLFNFYNAASSKRVSGDYFLHRKCPRTDMGLWRLRS